MRPTRTRNDPLKSLVGFVVGDVPYAIEIGRVVQIVNPLPIAALPHLPPGVAGVADYRGDVLAVIDLRARFGVPVVTSPRTKWIVVNVGGPCAAVVVDRVAEVFGTKGAELRPAPGLAGDDLRDRKSVV